MQTDKRLRFEKVGKVWRAVYAGPNGDATICSCSTKRATEVNAEFIMQTMPAATWRALVEKPNSRAA